MGNTGRIIAISIAAAILIMAVVGTIALSGDNIVREEGMWSDATDVLSGQAAGQVGREARDPYINTEQGNMLVFFFTLAGVTAGSIIGYNWRKLLAGKIQERLPAQKTVLVVGILLVIVSLTTATVHAFLRPLINPDLGDVVLFVFAASGAVSGFIAGNGSGDKKAQRRLAA